MLKKLSRFPYKDKSENTLIKYVCQSEDNTYNHVVF